MSEPSMSTALPLDTDAALWMILEGTATKTGESFFESLAERLSTSLDTLGAWVTEYNAKEHRVRTLGLWMHGQIVRGHQFHLPGSPCEDAITSREMVHIPDRLLELYPGDPDLAESAPVSYIGIPLFDREDTVIGHMAVIDRNPLPADPKILSVFRIFANRAAAELSRLITERAVREREERMQQLLNSTMDAIVELDDEMNIHLMNRAAARLFGCEPEEAAGKSFAGFLKGESHDKLRSLMAETDRRPAGEKSLWIPGGLLSVTLQGAVFAAEATLSRYEIHNAHYHTLILRNVSQRIEAERKIRTLTLEAEVLREELKSFQPFDEILGESEAVIAVLHDIKRVAPTGATVLIVGETGTGKELIARAIHRASPRAERPLIRVNCAAIPPSLMESEFFGHEKGAFTGATSARRGRFALADEGTIFLDEIGELPLELQGKLLRVLQESEFEVVGSGRTEKVDVRVIAATNRDLEEEVKEGRFREDLLYRLNVFPISVPPLRERGEDVVNLAEAFAENFSRRMGVKIQPLTEDCRQRLRSYPWPGNVRELQNVIERAIITAKAGCLNLDRALPDLAEDESPRVATSVPTGGGCVRTLTQMRELERQNILCALEAADWKVSGRDGAAALLEIPPTTLASRMKALKIERKR